MPDVQTWKTVQHELLRRLRERIWQPGQLIPTEQVLAEELGCSRATVNRALRGLAEGGLFDRRRKAGTRVAMIPVRKASLNINIIRLDVEKRGAVYRWALIEQQRTFPTERIRSRLGINHDMEMLYLRGLHLADEHPFIYEQRWINLAMVPGILDTDLNSISPNEWLVRHIPLPSGEIVFSAANTNASEASLLETEEGAAVFVIERTTWKEHQSITTVRMIHEPGFRMRTTT